MFVSQYCEWKGARRSSYRLNSYAEGVDEKMEAQLYSGAEDYQRTTDSDVKLES